MNRNKIDRAVVIALGIFTLSLSTISVRADSKKEAKAAFEDGIKQFENENYPMALSAFETSFRLRESGIVLFNIGMCQKALFRYSEAIESFRQLLDKEAMKASAEIRRDTEAAIRDIEENAGKLLITNAPEGAKLSINGRPVRTIPTERPLLVAAGRHVATLSKEGLDTKELRFAVTQKGEVTLDGSMEPETAFIHVDCPTGATVYLNDMEAGPCPFEGEVAPGAVEVKIKSPGKEDVINTVTAEPGGTASVIDQPEETPPPPELSPPKDDASAARATRKKRAKILLISGIAATALGFAGLGTGVAFSARYNREYDDVQETIDSANQAYRDGDKETYARLSALARDESDDLENSRYPKYRKGMIAGYTAGAILTTTGAVLLSIYVIGQKRERRIAVTPSPTGLTLTF